MGFTPIAQFHTWVLLGRAADEKETSYLSFRTGFHTLRYTDGQANDSGLGLSRAGPVKAPAGEGGPGGRTLSTFNYQKNLLESIFLVE